MKFLKWSFPVFLFAILVFPSGCYNHIYRTGTNPGANPNYSRFSTHLLFGLINISPDIQLNSICPHGIALIEDYHSFLNMVASALLLNVVSFSHITVYCAEGGYEGKPVAGLVKDIEITIDPVRARKLAALYPGLDQLIEQELFKDIEGPVEIPLDTVFSSSVAEQEQSREEPTHS